MRIGVYGLGYVGCVNAAYFARRGHTMIGVEVERRKVGMINDGISPLTEAGLDAVIAETVADGSLRATTEVTATVLSTDFSMICVGTPSNENGSLRLEYIEKIAHQLGDALRLATRHHVIVFRSTVVPGTVEEVLIPILAKVSGKLPGHDFSVVFHPEFLREGMALYDFDHPAKIIIGAVDGDALGAALLASLYGEFTEPVVTTSIRVAEAVKYIDNIFHALKVTFANEIGNICKDLRVDSHEAMRIFCSDHKLNLSSEYLKPGYAYGGSCLPKDLRALLYEAHTRKLRAPLLEAISISNEQQKVRAVELIHRTGKRRIGILGLSFKSATDDLRESPALALVEALVSASYHVTIYDPSVRPGRLRGATQDYVERGLPHVAALLRNSLHDVIEVSEVIVVTNRDTEFAAIGECMRPEQVLIDLVKLPVCNASRGNYVGISW